MTLRLGLSNLAWPAAQDGHARRLLPTLGVAGIEVAPTRIAPWDDLTPAVLARFRAGWAAAGLAIPSLQAIFYGVPGAQLLGDADAFAAMAAHLRRVAAIAEALGATVAVLGAPRNRLRGALPEPDAHARAAGRLRTLGDIAAAAGLTLGIEPVPAAYGSDCLRRAADVLAVTAACAHPAVRPHLDTACVAMEGDDIAAAIAAAGPALAHVHAAQPGLGGFTDPLPGHAAAAAALAAIGYPGWVVIEMQETPDPFAAITGAAAAVRRLYAPLNEERGGPVSQAAPPSRPGPRDQ